jgi:hypothetical protein
MTPCEETAILAHGGAAWQRRTEILQNGQRKADAAIPHVISEPVEASANWFADAP